MMEGIFVLRCVGCNAKEERPAEDCVEQPFCKGCYMPMFLEKVIAKQIAATD